MPRVLRCILVPYFVCARRDIGCPGGFGIAITSVPLSPVPHQPTPSRQRLSWAETSWTFGCGVPFSFALAQLLKPAPQASSHRRGRCARRVWLRKAALNETLVLVSYLSVFWSISRVPSVIIFAFISLSCTYTLSDAPPHPARPGIQLYDRAERKRTLGHAAHTGTLSLRLAYSPTSIVQFSLPWPSSCPTNQSSRSLRHLNPRALHARAGARAVAVTRIHECKSHERRPRCISPDLRSFIHADVSDTGAGCPGPLPGADNEMVARICTAAYMEGQSALSRVGEDVEEAARHIEEREWARWRSV